MNGKNDFVRKRSGLGGTGGHELSPELRARFGTFGFNKKTKDEPHFNFYDRNTLNSAGLTDFEGSTQALSSAGNREKHAIRGNSIIKTQDERETETASQHQPPSIVCSVDMGMVADEVLANRSISVGSYKRKKQVVLRKPYQGDDNTKKIKSLQYMLKRKDTM